MIGRKNYIQVSGWMLTDLRLSGHEIMLYALIYGFSQDGRSEFSGSLDYMAEWLNASRPTIISCLKSLIAKGHIVKTVVSEHGAAKRCSYRVNHDELNFLTIQDNSKQREPHGLKNFTREEDSTGKNSLPDESRNLTGHGLKNFTQYTSDNDSLNSSSSGGAQEKPGTAEEEDEDSLTKKIRGLFSERGVDAKDYASGIAKAATPAAREAGLGPEFLPDYLEWVFRVTERKSPASFTKYYRKAALNAETMRDFMLSPEWKRLSERPKAAVCPVCGGEVRPYSRCPSCGIDWSDRTDERKVMVERQVFRLPPERRTELRGILAEIEAEFQKTPGPRKGEVLQDCIERQNRAYGQFGIKTA